MWKDFFSSIGIDSVKVDTKLKKRSAAPGVCFARKICIKMQSFLHSQSPIEISNYFVRDRAFVSR
ncbi:hypothetical protein [Domibacillus enclensis]|uniref:Uncharacterized protein n=1 Tax=Domibacillus enclensis TaxID=1017273 RepID=A0A1N6NDW3_9BACI|nr:hypothetical protein [Domibacillus enclensis]SIP90241.1 hypothetical protein SAMN05443094_101118 [Domibacillus enclensis]